LPDRPVVDGTVSDLRFLDERGSVIALHALGRARHDATGFVVDVGEIRGGPAPAAAGRRVGLPSSDVSRAAGT